MKTGILKRVCFLAALAGASCRVIAGDLTVDGSLYVSNNLTVYGDGSVVSNLSVSGTISQGGSSLDGTYVNVSGDTMTGSLIVPSLTNNGAYASGDGRMVLGSGLSVVTISNTAFGACQMGKTEATGTNIIRGNACGAVQRGFNGGTLYGPGAGLMIMDANCYGAQQNLFVKNLATAVISNGAFGAVQMGNFEGASAVVTMGNNSYGAIQAGYVWEGVSYIGSWGIGCMQFGMNNHGRMIMPGNQGSMQLGVVTYAGATNEGNGSVQLLNLSSGQGALMKGNASLGLGACTVTDDNAIVAGDSQVSHGNGSITAVKFYGDGSGLSNLTVPTNAPYVNKSGDTMTGALTLQTNLTVNGTTLLAYIPQGGDIPMGVFTNQSQ